MFQRHVELYFHVVWSTWDRVPWVEAPIRARVQAVIASVARQWGCSFVAVGGVADHVHVLVRATATLEPAKLIGELKAISSRFAHAELGVPQELHWSGGYALLSVDPRGVVGLGRYLRDQEQHHIDGSIEPIWELDP